MASKTTQTKESSAGLFIVDNSDSDWKVRSYLREWCELSKAIDIATGYFEIGSLLALDEKWQAVDHFRILMGDEVSMRTKRAFAEGLKKIAPRLDGNLEAEKAKDAFLAGVPASVAAIRAGKIECRVYRPDKFHAKADITHARSAVVGSSALSPPPKNSGANTSASSAITPTSPPRSTSCRSNSSPAKRTPRRREGLFCCFRIPRPDPNLATTETGEIGLKDEEAVKVKTIHQLRPLHQAQPWGIFFVEFGKTRLPIVERGHHEDLLALAGAERLRRLLSSADARKRSFQDKRVTKQELRNEEKPLHSHHAADRRGESLQVDGRPK